MRQALRTQACAGLIGAALLLASCDGKETGPDTQASPEVPDVAAPMPPASSKPDLARWNLGFEGTDGDADGRISSGEYAASSTRLFSSMDADENGGLTVGELDAARAAMKITTGPSSEKLIERADNDGDDMLTLAEFVADVNARFAKADTDGDGFLSQEEFLAGHPEVRQESQPPTAAARPG